MENYTTPDLHDAEELPYIPNVIHESDAMGFQQWGNVSLSTEPDWIVEEILDHKIEESS